MSLIDKFLDELDLKMDDTILFTGNLTKLMVMDKPKNIEDFLNNLIDKIALKLSSGTIVFQTFNWDFCIGKEFNIKNTPSRTGAVGNLALKRDDFKRSKHPIYSFAIKGKYQNELIKLENKTSFGEDSPFSFLKKVGARMIVIDMPLQTSFTFVHYVEQTEKVDYRYEKSFKSYYVDENGNKELKEYSMFVRNLERKVETFLDPLEELLIKNGAMKLKNFNGIEIIDINLIKSYEIIKDDIVLNGARSIHKEF